jgi:hypothetical protein
MVMREVTLKVDAWTSAAQELMEARRRQGTPEAAPRVAVVATPETTQAARVAPPPAAPRFPSPAELQARSAQARPDQSDLSALPARLRDKITSDIEDEERREAQRRRLMPLVGAFLVLIVVAGAAMVLQQLHVIDLPFLRGKVAASTTATAASARPATSTATPAQVADTIPHPAPAPAKSTSLEPVAVVRPNQEKSETKPAVHEPTPPTTVAPPPSAKAPVATAKAPAPEPKATAKPAEKKPGAVKPAPIEKPASEKPVASAKPATAAGDSVIYGLGVASYLDRDRAEQERARLAAASGLPSSVVPFSEDGTAKFRVVIGHYPSNNAAENAALALMEKLGINEARPLVLSRGHH